MCCCVRLLATSEPTVPKRAELWQAGLSVKRKKSDMHATTVPLFFGKHRSCGEQNSCKASVILGAKLHALSKPRRCGEVVVGPGASGRTTDSRASTEDHPSDSPLSWL